MGKLPNRSGQAIIEYVMVLAIVISISGVIQYGVSRTRNKLWKRLICETAVACPGCPADQSVNNTLPNAGKCKK